MTKTCILIGAPIDSGQQRAGCLMGPAAYRTAGIARAITDLGHRVERPGRCRACPRSAPPPAPTRRCIRCPRPSAGPPRCIRRRKPAMAEGFPIIHGRRSFAGARLGRGRRRPCRRTGPPAVPALARRAFRFPHAADHPVGQPARHAGRLYRRPRRLRRLPALPRADPGRNGSAFTASARSIRPNMRRCSSMTSRSTTCGCSTNTASSRPLRAFLDRVRGRRRHAACLARRRFPRSLDRARRRHHRARRHHLPRGASGDGTAARDRASSPRSTSSSSTPFSTSAAAPPA